MDPERHALFECDGCHVVYGSETGEQPRERRVCGGTAFTYVRNLRTDTGG